MVYSFISLLNLIMFILKIKLTRSKLGINPRILVAKCGQDGHDRGAKVIASASAILVLTFCSVQLHVKQLTMTYM